MLIDAEKLARVLAKLYQGGAILEVGVGFNPWIACKLKRLIPKARVLTVDVNPKSVEYVKQICPTLEAELDDITKPNIKLYKEVKLIYSIRPPPELILPLEKLSVKLNASLAVRPLTGGETGYEFDRRKWVRIEGNLYLFRNPRSKLYGEKQLP